VRAATRLFEDATITSSALSVDKIVADGITVGSLLVAVPLTRIIAIGIIEA
jgi:hypothetical protein